jgi:hypothetical protein
MTREEWLHAWGFKDGTPEADKAWIEKQEFIPQRLNTLVMGDLSPYRAVAADIETGKCPMITSRSHHREFLKRNNYVELGNEMPKPHTPKLTDRKEIGHQIKRVIDEKGLKL